MGRLKIMVVDDELDFLELMDVRIKDWGYDFIGVPKGEDTVAAMDNEKPDIIVLDYMMPKMSGVEVLKEIRKTNTTIPVIMFTAYPNIQVMKDTDELGISAFVPKLSVNADTVSSLRSAISLAEKNLKGSDKAV